MVGLFVDDEVRDLMRREAENDRAAGRMAGLIMAVIVLAVIFGFIWWFWPSKSVEAQHEPPAVVEPARPHVPIKVDNVQSYAT